MSESVDKVEALLKYAEENSLLEDPERMSKLYDESRRRWGHLMTRYKIGKIMEETLRKMKK